MRKKILLLGGIFLILIIVLNIILELYSLRFRTIVYIPIIAYIGIYMILVINYMIKRRKIRIFCNVLTIVAIVVFLNLIIICMWALPEYVVEKNGEKWVAQVVAFTSTSVDYYQYINILIQSNEASFYEIYGSGAFNPFERDDYKLIYKYKLGNTVYYSVTDKN